jgi:hypothetical protein
MVDAPSITGFTNRLLSGDSNANGTQQVIVTALPTSSPLSAEIVHEYDALAALSMNVILIACLLAAYYVKHFRYYHIPESSISLLVGIIVGAIVRLLATTPDHLQLWEFVRVGWIQIIHVA